MTTDDHSNAVPHPNVSPERPPSTDERLWTPWRMRYVGGNAAEPGCIFCNRLASDDDVRSLILHRGEHAFVIMNLFPYNTGHVMIVPNTHVATPEEADDTTLASIGQLLRPTLRALRRALNCDGFNVGFNVGAVAGAGVADHLHQHVVPRWTGDANFMPILASTMTLPELIPVTYAKLRAELTREFSETDLTSTLTLAVLNEAATQVLVEDDFGDVWLPHVAVAADQSCANAVSQYFAVEQIDGVLAGWAGSTRFDPANDLALTFLGKLADPNRHDLRFADLDVARRQILEADRAILDQAIQHLAPGIR